MTQISPAVLAEQITSAIGIGGAEAPRLFPTLLKLLIQGTAVPPAKLAQALGWPISEVKAALDGRANLELDGQGNIVGLGLTLRKTEHIVEVDGRTLYAWCALDTLLFPALICRVARVTSSCAATGTPVRLLVTPEGVENVDPAGAVVSLVVPKASPDVRGVFCCLVKFFASAEAAKEWLALHPDAQVLPVTEAYQVGKEIVRRQWSL